MQNNDYLTRFSQIRESQRSSKQAHLPTQPYSTFCRLPVSKW